MNSAKIKYYKNVLDTKKPWKTIVNIYDRPKKKQNLSNTIKLDGKIINTSEEPRSQHYVQIFSMSIFQR